MKTSSHEDNMTYAILLALTKQQGWLEEVIRNAVQGAIKDVTVYTILNLGISVTNDRCTWTMSSERQDL